MKYPIGPETRKKAEQTQAGLLASMLNIVLYESDVCDVPIPASDATTRKWCVGESIYKGFDSVMPEGMHSDGNYFETADLMRAIRDFLEWQSFKEVIP